MDATTQQLNDLFPIPEPDFPSIIIPNPSRYPGWSHESTQTLLDCLRDNHRRHHIFFKEGGYHNHSTHHLLAIYAMGASADVIKSAYQSHVVYQQPAAAPPVAGDAKDRPSKGVITEANWKDHLGDEKYYQAYVAFFSGLLLEKGKSIQAVLEEYVFSKDANIIPGKSGSKPLMLSHFQGAFLHPLIHVGCGTEFGLPGLIAEGLALATAEKWTLPLYPDELWTSSITDKLSSLVISPKPSEDIHALTVLARVIKDPELLPEYYGMPQSLFISDGIPPVTAMNKVVEVSAKRLTDHADAWMKTVVPDRAVIQRKFKELAWLVTVAYGIGGWAGRPKGDDAKGAFNADFFNMHLVTSSVLLISQLNTLSLSSAALLLRTYFLNCLAVYVSRGRPPLPIADFYAATSVNPTGPTATPTPAKETLLPSGTPNPWLPIVQTTLVHPEEHLCKLQRALMHFAEVYGGTPPGAFAELEELAGAEVLDGTLFVRVAGLSADRLRWMREGEERERFDYAGFYPSSKA